MLLEVLDFAELLKQKRNAESLAPENLPIPSRQLSRTPPLLEE